MNQPITPITADFSDLSKPISKDELKAWYREKKGRVPFVKVGDIFGALIFGAVTVASVIGIKSEFDKPDPNYWLVLLPVMFGFVTIFSVFGAFHAKLSDTPMRLEQFLTKNNITPRLTIENPAHSAAIFNMGQDRVTTTQITGDVPRAYEIGDYQYMVRSGKQRTTYFWGYMVFPLNKSVPWAMLDALEGRTGLSNPPTRLDRRQHVHLMGELWDRFELYCAPSTEEFAKKFFTTDVLAALRHTTDTSFYAEFIDKRLYLYTRDVIIGGSEAKWRGNYQRINVISAKLAELGL